MLDVEIRRHAEEVAKEVLDEFMRGPALEDRVGNFLTALQARVGGLHDEVCGLSSCVTLQMQELASLRAMVAEAFEVAKAASQAPPVDTRRAACAVPTRREA